MTGATADTTPLSPAEIRHWTRIGTLCALSLLLGYLETFLPIPIPGVKLGLANIPVLVALAQGDTGGACWVALVKVSATGLLFGNPVTLAYSLSGTLLSLACMAPLSQLPTMRLEMTSVVGALAHEAGQLLVAQMLLGTALVWYGAPALAVAGCVTGTLSGMVARRAADLLTAVEHEAVEDQPSAPDVSPTLPERPTLLSSACIPWVLLGYVALVVVCMHAHTVPTLVSCTALALAGCRAGKMGPHQLGRTIAPTLPLALMTLVAQVANNQHGTILAHIGPVALTDAAIAASGVMLARLVTISTASVAVATLLGADGLRHCARAALVPLHVAGIATDGPQLAFSTTMRLLPLLSVQAERPDASSVWSRGFWTDELPSLVRDLYRQALRSAR